MYSDKNVLPSTAWDGRLEVRQSNLVHAPTWWQKQGLQQTRSGYGAKLLTAYKIRFNGRLLRVYCACWSNAGTCYIVSHGRKIVVDVSG